MSKEGLAVIVTDSQVSESTVNYTKLLDLGRELLIAIGEDPDREGIKDTPRRFASWWHEFIEYNPGTLDTIFEHTTTDQMVVVSDIRVWSLCEHHLLPFYCDISIGYITSDKVLGLSKFARIAHKHAHRLQLQERLTQGIGDEIAMITGSKDIAVVGKGEHLCMTMRGIQTPHKMTSSYTLGRFRKDHKVRDEFLQLIK